VSTLLVYELLQTGLYRLQAWLYPLQAGLYHLLYGLAATISVHLFHVALQLNIEPKDLVAGWTGGGPLLWRSSSSYWLASGQLGQLFINLGTTLGSVGDRQLQQICLQHCANNETSTSTGINMQQPFL
jgi:hypothetical protein